MTITVEADAPVSTKPKIPALSIQEIAHDDKRLKENKLCSRITAVKPGLITSGGVSLAPQIYMPNEQFASYCFKALEFLRFLQKTPLHCMTSADTEKVQIPRIGQRVPEKNRRNGIRKAWSDTSRTPQNKVETIQVSLFNTEVSPSRGIIFDGDSIHMVMDGAGRSAAAIDEINEILGRDGDLKEHPLIQRDAIVQINFDLSGNKARGLKHFIATNRDAKRMAKGTILSCESLLADLIGDDEIEWAYDNELARAAVIRDLYDDFPIHGTILEFLPWKFEGRSAAKHLFEGTGNASSLLTALKDLQPALKRTDIEITDLPKVLHFGFTQWYSLCPQSRADARSENKRRFSSTLALKVMILTTARIFNHTGDDLSAFQKMLQQIFSKHFRMCKTVSYISQQTQKMTPDRFFAECKYFADEQFNSGAANTQQILSQLNGVIDDILGKDENDE